MSIALQALILAACGSVGEGDERSYAGPCVIDEYCIVEGRLALLRGAPGSTGVISGTTWCVALALDKAVYREFDRWNDALVRVSGVAYRQPTELLWYELDGRRVALGVCDSGPVIYVEKIQLVRR